ncbi:MAG: T9SS type A sorting domain-containing protein [Chitinophagaceae bacterium]|nr:T9SS type A sorting domain-containing protein [Chitinophagaceae bacterium]
MKNHPYRLNVIHFFAFVAILSGLLGFADAQPYTIRDTFKTSGHFKVPAGVTSITIESWGGGGAGGGNKDTKPGGGGGGGGAYTKVTGYAVTPGDNIAVVVGAGGVGVSKGDGGNGGESYIGSYICRASGGAGGKLNDIGGAGGNTYYTYLGGNGADGSGKNGGGGGSSAGTGSIGNNGSGTSGGPAPTGGGKGGNASASAGDIPGGGGGGSKKQSNGKGGDGANGMVTITYTLSSVTTLYWAGAGSNIGGTTSIDFNLASNWSVSANSYVSKGQVPNATYDIVVRIEVKTGTTLPLNLTFSQANSEINNLDFSIKNVESNSSNIQEAGLSLNTNQMFTIQGNAILYAESNFMGKGVQLTMDCKGDNAVFVYNGDLSTSAVENVTGNTQECIVYPFSNPVGTMQKGKFILRGNADLQGCGDDQYPQLNKPATLVFDGIGTQTINNHNNAPSGLPGYPVFLAYETKIGETNSPTVILTGPEPMGFRTIKSLEISPNATLIIESSQILDCDTTLLTSPGAFTMGANSTLIVKANNFPVGYSSYSLDPSSTVQYISGNGVSQNIFGVAYGNLILTNASGSGNSDKNLTGSLTIKGDMTVNPYITLNQVAYDVTRAPAGGTFTLGNSDWHKLTGNYPSGFSTYSLATSSTTDYNGSGAQNVSPQNYGNLILSNAGTKTALGNVTVNGNLNIQNSAALAGNSYSHTVFGNWTNNSVFSPGTSTVIFAGSNAQNITGSGATAFNNLTINKSASGNTVTNAETDKAFSANNVTVTSGNLILKAIDNNYVVSGNLNVATNGMLTHSVSWDATYKALSISGNLDVTGIFNPTVRSHVAMSGAGNKTIRTGPNASSTLSILTFSTGNYTANGTLRANQEVWAMFGTTGTFSTGNNVVSFPAILNNMGTINVNNGGTLNITGDAQIGFAGTSGQLNIKGGGVMTIGGNLYNNVAADITFTGASTLNIAGNMINNGAITTGNETVTFNGTSDENISGSNPPAFYNLIVNGTNVVQHVNMNIINTLTLQSGIFNLQQYLCNRATVGGALVINSGATMIVGGSSGGASGSNFPKDFSTYTLQNGSTVNYNGSTQQIFNTTYGNLRTENAGTKTALNNLTILNSLTIGTASIFDGGNYDHVIGGDWINQSSTSAFVYGSGSVTFNGASAQSIGGSYGTSFYKLVMGNTSASGITVNQPVDIYAALTANGSGRKLNTNDKLTIKSTQTRTAYVGNMTGNTINGKATVERYVSAHKAWRLMSIPTNSSQTIKEAWQEGANNSSENPKPGYGIQITGEMSNWASKGFDAQSYSPSMKSYNPSNNTWVGITSTNSGNISGSRAYMVFVRGDRLADNIYSTPTQTNLRTLGNIRIGAQPDIHVAPGEYSLINNPYPSPIDFTATNTTSIDRVFYLWDPFLVGTYGLGGYQTFAEANNYEPLPGGTTSHPSGVRSTIIQSGEAFFVHADIDGDPLGGSIGIDEDAKVEENPVTFTRPNGGMSERHIFRTALTTPQNVIVDANAVAFSEEYSDNLDIDDARKILNSFENFGIRRHNTTLAVEARSRNLTDTIFYQMSGLQKKGYRLRFVPVNIERNTTAWLVDNFTGSRSEIQMSDTTYYDFTVNANAGSNATGRFMVVFETQGALPVKFVKVAAHLKSDNVVVEWKVADEKNNKEYVVLRSADGNNFSAIGTVPAQTSLKGAYSFTDDKPLSGWNYYRIKNVDLDGKAQLSDIVKVYSGIKAGLVSVYPNPVSGSKLNVNMNGLQPGKYAFNLYSQAGQVVSQLTRQLTTGNELVVIDWPENLPRGVYSLEIVRDSTTRIEVIRLTY